MAPSAIYFDESNQPNDIELPIQLAIPEESGNNNGAHELIEDALRRRVNDINGDTCDIGSEDAFFVADLGAIYRQHQRWKRNLSQVKPHYGMFILCQIYAFYSH